MAAVALAVRADPARLGKMSDPLFVLVARPGCVLDARAGLDRERRADRVYARHELAVFAEPLEDCASHARHDAHAHRDVRRVGELDADVRDVRADGSHREWNYV